MWTRTGTTTNRIAVGFQNSQSTIDMLGIIKLRNDWLIRVRASQAENNSIIQETLSTAGLQGSAIKYHESDKVFVLTSDSLSSVVYFINTIRPLMQDFIEIERAISSILEIDLSQQYSGPNWIRASNHSGSTRLKYFSSHQDSVVSEIGINNAGREWKIEIKTLNEQQKELLNHALQDMNFPLSAMQIFLDDNHGKWAMRLQSTDISLIANFVRVIKANSRSFEEIEPEISTLLGIDLTQNYVIPQAPVHSNTSVIRRQLTQYTGLIPRFHTDEIASSYNIRNLPFFNSHTQAQHQATVDLALGINAQILENAKFSSEETPDEYVCPISRSIMSDPVYLQGDETGQRFERAWITTWLRDKGTHPTTRKPFPITALQEDSELKNVIDEFVKNITDSNAPSSKK